MGRIFAIGDIHGCLDKLRKLLALIDADWAQDTVVFMGDYIDRGPASKEVVDAVLDLRRKHERVVCLMGNHERMFLNWLDGREEDLFLANGGRNTLRSYGIVPDDSDREAKVPADHLEFFRSLLPFYETETHLFVHAGVRPGLPMEIQDPHDMIWIRHEFFLADHGLNKTVVFGHTPFTGKPYVGEKRIGIDTGAVYGGTLTCLELPAMKFHQV
ncbi:MAG: serine/threonine protein phosphatase [Syntrophales bacterium]|jgi:serine/threonine protein phosphatase 1|nr:serine/threonine protein phosphatase [Syntrophales bacterium]